MKTILITGTGSGFGKLLTQQLSEKGGFTIYATLRNSEGQNSETRKELEKLPNVHVAELDVTSDNDVNTVVQNIQEQHQAVDILINNAGVFGGGLLEAHSIEQVKKLFDVNVYGPLRLSNVVLPAMRQQGEGLIINLSSMLGFFPSL